MARTWNLVVVGLTLAIGGVVPAAQAPTLKGVMREKLANTQQLLGAVVTADYAAIERHGEALSRITYVEIASWQSTLDPDYQRQANAFLMSVLGLRQAAADRNINAAMSGYTALISSCIQCHTAVRRSRVVSLAPFDQLPQAPAMALSSHHKSAK